MITFLKAKPTKFFCFLLSFLMLTLNLPDPSYACWGVPGPGCGASCPICPTGGGNHIIEPTGNLYFWLQIINIPGKGLPLTIDLVYNSQASEENGPFGYGWSLNFDMRISTIFPTGEWIPGAEGGRQIAGTPYIELRQANGYVKIFDLHTASPDARTYLPRRGEYELITYYPTASPQPYYIRELKNGTKYRFNADGRIISITDANDNTITIHRYVNGLIDWVSDAGGRKVEFYKSEDDKTIEKITGPDGSAYNFEYANDNLVKYWASDWEEPIVMNYGSSHRMTSRIDTYGNSVVYTYDNNGLISSRRDRNLNTVYFDYESNHTTVTDPKGHTRLYYHNNEGQLTQLLWGESIPGGPLGSWQTIKTEHYSYGATGMLIAATDGEGNTTRYEYDARDNRTAVIDADGIRTEFAYDDYNNVTAIVQAVGTSLEREFTLDYGVEPEKRNLVEIAWEVDSVPYSRQYEYFADGTLQKYTDARGKEYDFTYTAYGNLETITDPLNNITELDYYDNAGRLRSITNALDFTTSYSYIDGCACNPLQSIEYPDGSFTEFSRNYQRIVEVKDRNGNKTRYPEYDGKSQLEKLIDALGNTADFTYDENDNLETIRDAHANITSYEYDGADRLVKTTYADDSCEELTYDAADNITSRRLRSGAVISYQYDDLNRLTLKTYPDSTTVEYGYDILNRLADIENYYYVLHYEYDDISRVEWFACTDKGTDNAYTVSYSYDAEGNRTSIAYPSGYDTSAAYDDLNRLNEIKDPDDNLIADYDYDAMRRTGVTVFNAGTEVAFTSYTYDDANSKPDHLISLSNWKSDTDVVISSFDYTYDNEGNRLSMAVEPAWGIQTGTIDYDYDLIYQVTGAEGPGFETYPDASFTYDSMGNRVETVFSGQTDNYTSNQLNQYTEVSSTDYQYDLNGNLTDDGNQLYQYDYENRLSAIRRKSDNALVAEYRYDPFGRRAKKITDAGATVVNYLYDGAQVIEERDGDFELVRRFVYGPGIDEPVSIHNVISGETYFYQRDGLGSVTELTDTGGNVIERYRYSPYGKLKIYDGSWNQLTGSAVGNPYFFTGRRYDPESGLYYYRARMYSSEVGRFLQTDPIGYWDGFNQYRYVSNNPIIISDPFGMQESSPLESKSQLEWSQKLIQGHYFGTHHGEWSANYWAKKYIQPDNKWYEDVGYFTGGCFSSLWTAETWWKTTGVLALAGVVDIAWVRTGQVDKLQALLDMIIRLIAKEPHNPDTSPPPPPPQFEQVQ